MSFADPRDGDLEDDASSTSHHSLLGHATHMLLEISLPKLIVAALLLLIIPAVLLGAAPKVAFWFAETVWNRVSEFGRVASIGTLVVVVGAVLWRWGASLFLELERSVWALNAGLVQPLYMGVREVVRLAIEKIAHTRDLAATRRVAGLVAGVVIALLAAAVAWRVGPLPTLFMDDLTPAGLLRTAEAAFANGIWAVAVYLMVSAPLWSITEAIAGTPVDVALGEAEGPAAFRVVHLSDIHVVGEPYGFRLECGRIGPRGNWRLDRVFELLEAADRERRLDWILVTGDITDAGRNAEFIVFDEVVARHPSLRDRLLIIPGNHDVNIVDRANPARLELPIAPGGPLRRLRMLSAMARLQGHRVRVIDRRTKRPGATLNEFLAADDRGTTLARFMNDGGVRAGALAREIWNDAFPLVVEPSTPDGLGIVLLDSNAETHFSFTNALGLVGIRQLRAAEAAMRLWPRAGWLVALHHHLVEYPRPGAALGDRIGTALTNGHWVVQQLRRQSSRLVVMHGHRHYDWMGRCGGLRIVSAPSPVMKALDDAERHFWIHHFRTEPDGSLAMLPPERINVPGLSPQPPSAAPSAAIRRSTSSSVL